MKRTTRIAVIGAGLGGATVAALLQREGFEVRLYEQAGPSNGSGPAFMFRRM
jgi:6-hydroxynicotinate 3-monooxygenase